MSALALAVLLVLPVSSDTSPVDAPTPVPTAAPTAAPESTPPPEAVAYPIALPAEPDLLANGDPFKLVDLRYHVTGASTTTHEFGARVRVRDWGYLGAAFDGERRTVTASTHRLDLLASEENRRWDLLGLYRTPRFIFQGEAQRRPIDELSTVHPGWILSPTLSVRVARDLELIASATGDTATPYDHFLRAESGGFLWQPSSRLDLSGLYEHAREANETNYENTRNTGELTAVAQVGSTELSADARVDDINGRFPRTDLSVALGARVPVTPRLLVEAQVNTRIETELRAHEYRGVVTWFARRFTLPHAGLAAERAAAFARRATALGENERKAYDDESRRQQRERLSLSPHARELATDIAELYRAQVEERSVPTLGFEYVDREDTLPGTSSQTFHAIVGIPWPPAPPWAHNDNAVPFLRLDLTRNRRVSGNNVAALQQSATLTASLNREMDLLVGWRHTDPTLLDIVRAIAPETVFEVSFVYAFGR